MDYKSKQPKDWRGGFWPSLRKKKLHKLMSCIGRGDDIT